MRLYRGERRRDDEGDQVAYFSNVAPFLSLFAPGDESSRRTPAAEFAVASGTSMAAPHVAGAWAVLKQAVPTGERRRDPRRLSAVTGMMITDTRAGTGTTRPRIQVDLALNALLNPGVPIIASISPERGSVGTSLTVTVDGINFEPGASASFGAGVTVTSTTVVSSIQLSVAIAIAATAARARGTSRSRIPAGRPRPARAASRSPAAARRSAWRFSASCGTRWARAPRRSARTARWTGASG